MLARDLKKKKKKIVNKDAKYGKAVKGHKYSETFSIHVILTLIKSARIKHIKMI